MKRHHHDVLFTSPAAALALLLAVAVTPADAAEIAFTRLSVHGKPRCVSELPPESVYVARRPNSDGLPTDDVAIVDWFLESDTALPAVRIYVWADLSAMRPGLQRDISKLFVRVAPDGTRTPLRHELPIDEGLTAFSIELERPLADHHVARLPLMIPLRLRIAEGGDGPELATSPDATWRLVSTSGEAIASARGGTLIQRPDGGEAVEDAQVAVLYGCRTMPHVEYALTGVAIRGRGRTPTSRLKSVRVHLDGPEGPVVSEALADVALPVTVVDRYVIDLPDVQVLSDEAVERDFFVVVTFADGGTDLVGHPAGIDEAVPAELKGVLFRPSQSEIFEPSHGMAYAIDLLIDGRLQTAD